MNTAARVTRRFGQGALCIFLIVIFAQTCARVLE